MKKITLLKSILFAIILICFSTTTKAQTLVNREWVTTGGNPNEHFDFVNATSANGFFYLIGSSYHSTQQDNFYIAKIEGDGTIHWFKEFNSLSNWRDFGIDITVTDTFVYVAGMSWDSTSNTSQIATLRLDDNNGNILWSQSWGSRYNVPVKIITDNLGNVYTGGTAQTSATEFGMVVLKYSPSGSLDWTSYYDSTGIMDGAIALLLDSPQANLTVTGYSGNGFNNWDFATVQIDATTGNIKNTTITQNGNGNFSQPVGLTVNGQGNTYIGGTVTHPTTGKKRVKLISYNSLWQENYVNYFGDSATETEAVEMHNDWTGGNVILGTHTRTDGHKEIILTRFMHDDGSLLWNRTLTAPTGEDAEAGSFTVAGDDNNIYLTGSIKSNTGRYRMVTAAYNLDGNLLWMKEYNRTSTSNDKGKSIEADEDGNPIATSISVDSNTTVYASVKYSQWLKPNDYISDNNGKPLYMNGQLIVKFRKDMVNKSFTDNTDLLFTNMGEALNSWAFDTLLSKYPGLFNNSVKVEKIYKGLKSTYTTSIARNGDNVPVPDFWASLLIYIPNNAARSAIDWKDTLNVRLFPLIEYANLNYTATLQSSCDPSSNVPDDSYYYPYQEKSLYYPDLSIGVDSAWCLETGKPFVKVGIYDAGLDGRHEDFGGDGQNFNPTKAKGYDFMHSVKLESTPTSLDILEGHATAIAGIIGAIRNNGKGIAGIAGGDYTANADSSGQGVTLHGMKIMETNFNTDFASLSVILDGYITGASDIPNSDYGFGLHITNNSFGFILVDNDSLLPNNLNPLELNELTNAVHYINRNQVAFCVAAGNLDDVVYYPTNLNEDWCTVVSATNRLGEAQRSGNGTVAGNDADWNPFKSEKVDIAAPGVRQMTFTTKFNGGYSYSMPYQNIQFDYFKTSIATAYVTGVGALLKSYLDTTISAPQNLSPEDVEQIITKNAVDIDTFGKDIYSGWGRLNASRVLKYVNKSCRKVKHFTYNTSGIGSNIQIDSTKNFIINPFSGSSQLPINIKLSERYKAPYGYIFDTVPYSMMVERYKFYYTIPIDSNYKIIDVWARNSSSTVFGIYDSSTSEHILKPYEKVKTTFLPPNKLIAEGYMYWWVDTNNTNNTLGVLGSTDTTNSFIAQARIDFTVVIEDTINNCFDTIPTITKVIQLKNGIGYTLYPNPTQNNSKLTIYTDKNEEGEIILTDIAGRILNKQDVTIYGVMERNINLDEYADGIYILKIKVGNYLKTIKINKL